jgi:hypothetical protein
MTKPYTMLVNSCDAFEDCWHPFFTLLGRYWVSDRPRILLNTESKSWVDAEVDVITTKVQRDLNRRLSWSECLEAALHMVDTPLVLYLQEDYFIETPVDVDRIDHYASLMMQDPDIQHIGLTHFGAGHPLLDDPREGLSCIGPRATYRISTQAGLWRTETLLSYLLPWESGWMFELLGTMRSWRRSDQFLTLDRRTTRPAIEYQHTGIVKGKWSPFVLPLFEKEGLVLDYDIRGICDPQVNDFVRRFELLKKIIAQPKAVALSVVNMK